MTLLQVKDLSIAIKGHSIVKSVSFNIGVGECVGLVGTSGSGKSLTAQAIVLPVGTVSGAIHFEGENLLSKSHKAMQKIRGKKIGMIFQEPMTALNPTMTIGTQISEVLCRHEGLNTALAREKTIRLLSQVKIHSPEQRFNQYPHEFSGGMRQRVMIAMALACDPLLLIADEPTTALDVTVQTELLHLLQEMQRMRALSLLFISHDLGVIAKMCSQVMVMHEGEIVEAGPIEAVLQTPSHPYTRQLLSWRRKR